MDHQTPGKRTQGQTGLTQMQPYFPNCFWSSDTKLQNCIWTITAVKVKLGHICKENIGLVLYSEPHMVSIPSYSSAMIVWQQ
jgi:hypothetical protein